MQNFTVVMLNESVLKSDIENYFGSSLLSLIKCQIMTGYE